MCIECIQSVYRVYKSVYIVYKECEIKEIGESLEKVWIMCRESVESRESVERVWKGEESV